MKAIVLTFDKYRVFADHMISCYMRLWPDNPLIFSIPYQSEETKKYFEHKYGSKVEMVLSGSGIVETIYTLLEGFDDSDWVFWCMDDRYPISLDICVLDDLYKFVQSKNSDDIFSLMYMNTPWGRLPENLHYSKNRKKYEGYTFLERRGYRMIWIHQFMKVEVIRALFSNFPKQMKAAKDMDFIMYKLKKPEHQKFYALDHNIAMYGESTSRGMLTTNCAASLAQNGFDIPDGFCVGDKKIVQGDNSKIDDAMHFIKHHTRKALGIKPKE